MTSKMYKIKQEENYLEYEFRDGEERFKKHIFRIFSLICLPAVFVLLDIINAKVTEQRIQDLWNLSSVPSFSMTITFLVFFILSFKMYLNPYLLILNNDLKQLKYRSFYNMRNKTRPLRKLKEFSVLSFDYGSGVKLEKMGIQLERKVRTIDVIFIFGEYKSATYTLYDIRLKEWIQFFEDINIILKKNFNLGNKLELEIENFKKFNGGYNFYIKLHSKFFKT